MTRAEQINEARRRWQAVESDAHFILLRLKVSRRSWVGRWWAGRYARRILREARRNQVALDILEGRDGA